MQRTVAKHTGQDSDCVRSDVISESECFSPFDYSRNSPFPVELCVYLSQHFVLRIKGTNTF